MTLLQTLIITIPYDPQWSIGPRGKTLLMGKKQDVCEAHGGEIVIINITDILSWNTRPLVNIRVVSFS